ncbi:DUF1428 domain-containing protein [Parerythrobacter lacustris]|uniref:DUF1428 domain-containing protein n=1 Tax=Parerythrobacter lacustris TaxID=2969984 RepID=A0ABT1XTU7_9SPHN|nr:DUF1428 domain-containing protein [Parerythrobacter lacustris]MCR2835084.1 DUF1428 domain-containing protein [Parerythrobacter lacustris]
MYVQGFVIPVPEGKKDAYREVAEKFWPIAKDHGALSQVECWEADVKDGTTTDFRMAVKAEGGEKIVFSWMTWPDKATADASHDKLMADPRMAEHFGDGSDMPFDGKRMIFGGFEPIFEQQA